MVFNWSNFLFFRNQVNEIVSRLPPEMQQIAQQQISSEPNIEIKKQIAENYLRSNQMRVLKIPQLLKISEWIKRTGQHCLFNAEVFSFSGECEVLLLFSDGTNI